MKNNDRKEERGRHENPLRGEISREEKRNAMTARVKAEKDIENDPEFSAKSPNDDLDEGELGRLGEKTDLV
jgi:hypothetical protein